MEKYIHLFENESDYNAARSNGYKEPWVSATNIGEVANPSYRVNYNKSEEEKLLGTPLTFEITSAGNIVWKANNTAYTVTLEYSKNGGEWSGITSTTGGTSISVSAGDTIQFRCGTDDGYATMSSSSSRYNTFSGTTAGFKVKGNIMSLLSKDNFATADTLQSAYTFAYLLQDCTGLVDASKLILPATTLAERCYNAMFSSCRNLTTAPELPATTLTQYCYSGMFSYTSLTAAPELPATTLDGYCYAYMFSNCTGLTTAPELPATTLAPGCYGFMFSWSTSLNYIKAMFTTTPSSSYTYNWVSGVASSGTFVKNSAATWTTTGDNGIPNGWTVETAAS